MKIHKLIKIESVASNDSTRWALNAPYLDITEGKGTLVATDGRMMAIVPVEIGEHDVSGYCPAEVLKHARKLASKASPLAEVSLNGDAKATSGFTLPRNPGNANFPTWRQVVPGPARQEAFKVRFNAEYLYRLAQALGSDSVELSFAPHETQKCYDKNGKRDVAQPILVRPVVWSDKNRANMVPEPKALGILMPIGFE